MLLRWVLAVFCVLVVSAAISLVCAILITATAHTLPWWFGWGVAVVLLGNGVVLTNFILDSIVGGK